MTTDATSSFVPPGPGTWMLDSTHWTRPVTAFAQEIFPAQFRRGFAESLARYGLLLDYLDFGYARGFPYASPRPVGAPPGAGLPPRHVWEDLASSHPEISARLARSATIFEDRRWREDLVRWDNQDKVAAQDRHLELQKLDPRSMSADELSEHLETCRKNLEHWIYVHHRYNVPSFLPVGDFLAHAAEWTRETPAVLLTLLQGASPESRGAENELNTAAGAVADDPEARSILASSGDAAGILKELRALPDGGPAVSRYVERVGLRLVNGLDVGDEYVLEMPEILVAALRAPIGGGQRSAESGVEDRIADVRRQVPNAHRQHFDELLGEARLLYRLREERGLYADVWAYGLMRRALLAAGQFLADKGLVDDPEHAVEATHGEIASLLRGDESVGPAALSARASWRREARFSHAPQLLGGDAPPEPLPTEWLPPSAARAERAIGTVLDAIFGSSQKQAAGDRVEGFAASPGSYTGTARVVIGTDGFGAIRQGDILVTKSTSAAFNIVLPLLGAIITERGGLLSHAAIVAREYGIPAVVGTNDATQKLRDGMIVRVDGAGGFAEVVRG